LYDISVSILVMSDSTSKSATSYCWNAASRSFSASAGSIANNSCCSLVNGSSNRGATQIGVRWKTVRCSVSAAMAGTYWTALAPVPIDATRSPAVDFE